MSESYELLDVDKVTVGAIGEPGRRLFLLQARNGTHVITLKLEKVQVAALSAYLGRMMQDLSRPAALPEDLEIEEPAEPAWVIGSLGATYDEALDRLLLVADEALDEDDPDSAAQARIGMTREQMAALALRGAQLVNAGRAPCPLCGYPLDPSGHDCPRTNGHRPPTL